MPTLSLWHRKVGWGTALSQVTSRLDIMGIFLNLPLSSRFVGVGVVYIHVYVCTHVPSMCEGQRLISGRSFALRFYV